VIYRPIEGVNVLGLCGHARAGKDTLAKALMKRLPGAERFAVSDGIAAYARAIGAMQDRVPSVLQDVGWSLLRDRPGVWLDVLYGAMNDRRPTWAIVTGVRFDTEAAMIRGMGGSLVRVTRLEPGGEEYVTNDRNVKHIVESGIDGLVCDQQVRIVSGRLAGFDDAAEMLTRWLVAA
jgi:hypothetical protein